MSTQSVPLCQIRFIGAADQSVALLAHITEHAQRLFGECAIYRTHTRSARRTGYVRVYLTVTRKEEHH
jgi:hypothetical protein